VASSGSKKTTVLICLGLALAIFGVYWQVHGFDYVNYDDPVYSSANPVIARGLTFRGIAWAFTHVYFANWYPLTLISHMLDCQIFGINAGGPHVVNVLFHTANTILLFLLLRRITGEQWPSAIIAAIFALHPLHVESVAWISERKDVLSTFFGLFSLLAYVRYVDETKIGNARAKTSFRWALVLFALSLMSKPMLVTLPCLMLLLDFWPLQRIENSGWRTFSSRPFLLLVKEKWPWFALVLILSAVTLFTFAQSGVTVSSVAFPTQWRVPKVIDSYFWYFEKTFWPTKLAFFYPLLHVIPVKTFVVSSICMLLVTVAAFSTIKRWPFYFVGWAWFLVTLVPVIGLVPVGSQATADRYSYVSMVGLLIAIIAGARSLLSGSKTKMLAGGMTAGILLAALATATYSQIGYWKNTATLCRHALDVTHDNLTALNNLGVYFSEHGLTDDAEKMYRTALDISPGFAEAHENLGHMLAEKGDTNGALFEYQEAVRLNPNDATTQNGLAETFVSRGKNEDALPHFSEAARLKPENAQYQNDLAVTLVALGKGSEALPFYARAVQLEPGNAQFQNNFATALLRAGDMKAAEAHYRAAIADDPKLAEPYSNLGALLFARQQYIGAASIFGEAVRLSPTNAGIHFNAGLVYLKAHRIGDARTEFAEAARLRPDWTDPLVAESWALATSNDAQERNGAEAVKLAEKAADLTGHKQPAILNTLAAAYAESGRFDDALATANRALELAKQSNHTNLFPRIEHAIVLYQARTPMRESTSAR
jgi:protein O-mannosyl-transferase